MLGFAAQPIESTPERAMQERIGLTTLAAAAIAALHPAPARATDWLQFGYDIEHSSFNRAETGYPTPSGNTVLYHYALRRVAG